MVVEIELAGCRVVVVLVSVVPMEAHFDSLLLEVISSFFQEVRKIMFGTIFYSGINITYTVYVYTMRVSSRFNWEITS